MFLLRAVLNILVRNASTRGPMCFRCLMLCVALLMCLFVLCVACVGVVAILLLNVMDVFSECGGALLDRPCMVFQRVCVLCL